MKIVKEKINQKFSDGLQFVHDIGRKLTLGEVFTPRPVIDKMLTDLCKRDTSPFSLFIEPGSGHGNFGIQIFKKKINLVLKKLRDLKLDDEKWHDKYILMSLQALTSIYQNDIDEQNISELKSRLHRYVIDCYKKYSKTKSLDIPVYYDVAITNILDSNCLRINFLTPKPIYAVFYYFDEWNVYRIKKNIKELIKRDEEQLSIFDNVLTIANADMINIKDWRKDMSFKNYVEIKNAKSIITEDEAIEIIKKELLEKFGIRENSDFKFSYCISNPPYQESVSGKRHQPIYLNFFNIATKIADKVSMIFPLAWQKNSGKGHYGKSATNIQNDTHIVSVDNYYEDPRKNPLILFETASTGGVNIILWDSKYNNKGLVDFYEYGNLIRKIDLKDYKHLDPLTKNIFEKIQKYQKNDVLTNSMLAQYCNGINFKTFRKNYPDQISEKSENGYAKAYTRVAQNKFDFMFFSKKIPDLKIKDEYYKKYKVILIFTGPNTHYRTYKILKPNELWDSDTYLCKLFDTESEAKNFVSYVKTNFYAFALTENTMTYSISLTTYSFVPDLKNIKNPRTQKIGWQSDWTDDDLKSIFTYITKSEWEHINKIALISKKG